MSPSNAIELGWEWPADRTPDVRALVVVESAGEPGSGLFGIRRSPSIASNLPDPIKVTGRVLVGPDEWSDTSVIVTVPSVELGEVAEGDHVALGVIGHDTCICIARVPDDVVRTALQGWLAEWDCDGS